MLQPFKHITLVMKDKTNLGVTAYHDEAGTFMNRNELQGDHRGYPVTVDDDGYGVFFNRGNRSAHATIGVLLESFNKPYAQHKVLVHGIVPMKAKANVKAGTYVYWDDEAGLLVSPKVTTAGSETPYVGRALTSAPSTADGMIDVLIG